MPLSLKKISYPPLDSITAAVPNGAIIGLVGEQGAGQGELLMIVAGLLKPSSGSVSAGKNRRLVTATDTFDFSPADVLLVDHVLARQDAIERARTLAELRRLQAAGTVVIVNSHDDEWMRRSCDEVWWIRQGTLAERGDPDTVITAWRRHVAGRVRTVGEATPVTVSTAGRRGDARAEIQSVEILGQNGRPTATWKSGEAVEVRLKIRFLQDIREPVVGLLIRNRIGLDVYGTNTELERLKIGPRGTGDVIRLAFRFVCGLCPQEYTLTIASHDPDGTRHDWLEEAVAVSVVDDRYTAGVANLRAKVTLV